MTQFFCLLNTEEEHTLLARGEETTTPQAIRALNCRVPRVHVHQENTQFFTNQFMECQLQMHEVVQKLVNTLLFCFQDLKLSTRDIIAILKDTLNITSRPLQIPDPHAKRVPSNTLERHSIGSSVVDGVRNLVINFSMAKLVGSPTSNSTFTYQKGAKTPRLWICYSAKALWIAILFMKSFTHFRRWCLVRELPSPPELPLSTILGQ